MAYPRDRHPKTRDRRFLRGGMVKSPGDSGEDWLTSYADLVTLLMTFFVLLVSISAIDASKYEQIAQSFSADGAARPPQKNLNELYQELTRILREENLSAQVEAKKTPTGIAISVPGAYLFRSGSAEISEPALPLVRRLADIIRVVPYQIAIEGHTDDVPIHSREFPSNWELSTARASRIVRFMIDHSVDSRRLRAIGFADTRPVAPNIDPKTGESNEFNRARNRRVVIRFLAF